MSRILSCSYKRFSFFCSFVLTYFKRTVTASSTWGKNITQKHQLSQNEDTGSHSFTKIKPCWMRLITGWVTNFKNPVMHSLGSQNGILFFNRTSCVQCHCMCNECQFISSGCERFLRVLLPPKHDNLRETSLPIKTGFQ